MPSLLLWSGLGALGPASGPKRRSLNIILVRKRQMVPGESGAAVGNSGQKCEILIEEKLFSALDGGAVPGPPSPVACGVPATHEGSGGGADGSGGHGSTRGGLPRTSGFGTPLRCSSWLTVKICGEAVRVQGGAFNRSDRSSM